MVNDLLERSCFSMTLEAELGGGHLNSAMVANPTKLSRSANSMKK
jgi:hypothetical protein